jgi:hypothetical protein
MRSNFNKSGSRNDAKRNAAAQKASDKRKTKTIQPQRNFNQPNTNNRKWRGHEEGSKSSTYIASQVRAFTIAAVDAALRGVPVVAVIVAGALTVELAIAIGNVTQGGL